MLKFNSVARQCGKGFRKVDLEKSDLEKLIWKNRSGKMSSGKTHLEYFHKIRT